MLLTMPILYKLISKNEVCGNIVSRNPNSTPNTAAIKICVFKLIFSCIFNIDLKPHYAMRILENRVIFYKRMVEAWHQMAIFIRLKNKKPNQGFGFLNKKKVIVFRFHVSGSDLPEKYCRPAHRSATSGQNSDRANWRFGWHPYRKASIHPHGTVYGSTWHGQYWHIANLARYSSDHVDEAPWRSEERRA